MFSARFQSVLSMINGGQDWLSWIMNDSSAPMITVTTEDELLLLIQQGLYNDDYVRFNTFRAAMTKILSLPDMVIAQLASIRLSVNDNEQALAVLLQQNGIRSYGTIAGSSALAISLASGRPDLFQALSFGDQLTLTAFSAAQEGVDADLQAASFTFAQGLAATVADFVHQCLFYQTVVQNQLPADLVPQTQAAQAGALYQQLLRLVRYLLFTPNVEDSLNGVKLMTNIRQVAGQSTFIGYATASSAVLNLAQNLSLSNQTDAILQSRITVYLQSVKSAIGANPATGYTVSQDGAQTQVSFQSGASQVLVGVNGAGSIYLLPSTKINN